MEKWNLVKDYEDCYAISNEGNIKSITRFRKSYIRHVNVSCVRGKILTLKNTPNGYKFIIFYRGGKQKSNFIHRLVAQAFITNLDNKPCVNHKDGNKHNNRVENLEWCTYLENKKHACENGLVARGERGNSKLKEADIIDIRKYKGIGPASTIANKHNISRTNVYDIWSGKIWKHVS